MAGRRPLTLRKYRSVVDGHIVPVIGDVALRDLQDDHVVTLLAGIESRSVAAYTFTVLRAALNCAVRRRLIPVHPCAAVDPPRVERDEPAFLDPARAAKMFSLARGERIEGAVLLGLAGGLRIAETVTVRWSDLNLATGRLTVARSWWGQTKSGKVRSFILPASAVAALRRVKMRQAEDLLAIGVRADDATNRSRHRPGFTHEPASARHGLRGVLLGAWVLGDVPRAQAFERGGAAHARRRRQDGRGPPRPQSGRSPAHLRPPHPLGRPGGGGAARRGVRLARC